MTQQAASGHLADVRRYATTADAKAVAAIVLFLGIALRSKDGASVSCSSKSERDRVRESWLKLQLGLDKSNAELDAAIASVCARMKADRMKSRVTFYYLLAEHFGRLTKLRES